MITMSRPLLFIGCEFGNAIPVKTGKDRMTDKEIEDEITQSRKDRSE